MNLASQQLSQHKVNGARMLIGNVANEGSLFVPPNMITESDLTNWLHQEFENLSTQRIQQILTANPNSANTNHSGLRFETDGIHSPNAVNMSADSNGQQQRGANILAESTFVCPSYWMADAYSTGGKSAWHYQYSVPFAFHGTDVAAYFGPKTQNQGSDVVTAVRKIWGNFVTAGNPSISNAVANGAGSANPSAPNGASNWPKWTLNNPQMLNINQTGGVPYQAPTFWGTNVTQFMEPGLSNALSVVNADTWEGGRGSRCDFWLGLAPHIPA
jgi:carboxylesterase type B